MKMLLYSCKAKPYLYQGFARPMHTKDITNPFNYKWCLMNYKTQNALNGKIVAECDFEVEEIYSVKYSSYIPDEFVYKTISLKYFELEERSCLTQDQLFVYLTDDGNRYTDDGYVIHIRNLHIFDEPKELSELYSIHDVGGMLLTDKLKKAPQNMQRISLHEWEYGTYNSEDMAILIPIHSEHLCKILNDECSIIVKKKVLKEMI